VQATVRLPRLSGQTAAVVEWQLLADDGGETQVVLLPLLMDGRRPGVRHALPRIGEHNDEVLASPAQRMDPEGASWPLIDQSRG
jgi:crotonobetainyl-CoA:carnitine CoA-transferase CaiB-like acyl-CoA transferase